MSVGKFQTILTIYEQCQRQWSKIKQQNLLPSESHLPSKAGYSSRSVVWNTVGLKKFQILPAQFFFLGFF